MLLAIDPDALKAWRATLGAMSSTGVLAGMGGAGSMTPVSRDVDGVRVIGLRGFIGSAPDVYSMMFGGTSPEALVAAVREGMREPSVRSIVLAVDSPGGEVFGLIEAAAALRSLRGTKPMVSVVSPLAASAAYWLASQADEVVATPSGLTGSIGAFVIHEDVSQALAQQGVKLTIISYGAKKTAGNPYEALSPEARASLQERIDFFGSAFERDVAAGRRVPVSTVRSGYGEGAIFTSPQAKLRGLVDSIGTLEETVGRLRRNPGRPGGGRADGGRAYDPVELRLRARLLGVKWPPTRSGRA
jgi:signal peptide peptidase SppA